MFGVWEEIEAVVKKVPKKEEWGDLERVELDTVKKEGVLNGLIKRAELKGVRAAEEERGGSITEEPTQTV